MKRRKSPGYRNKGMGLWPVCGWRGRGNPKPYTHGCPGVGIGEEKTLEFKKTEYEIKYKSSWGESKNTQNGRDSGEITD